MQIKITQLIFALYKCDKLLLLLLLLIINEKISSCRMCNAYLSAFIFSLLNDDLEFEVLTRRARSHKFFIRSLFFQTIRVHQFKGHFCATSHREIVAKHLTNLKVLFPPAVVASETANFRKPSKIQTTCKHLRVSLLPSVYSFRIVIYS